LAIEVALMRSFTALVQREEDGWVSLCPELDVASQGDTPEEAKANLREAVELFLETAPTDEVERRFRAEVTFSPLEVRMG